MSQTWILTFCWERKLEAWLQADNNEKKAFIIPHWLENRKNKSDKSSIVVTVIQSYASLHLLLIEWQFLFMMGVSRSLGFKMKDAFVYTAENCLLV